MYSEAYECSQVPDGCALAAKGSVTQSHPSFIFNQTGRWVKEGFKYTVTRRTRVACQDHVKATDDLHRPHSWNFSGPPLVLSELLFLDLETAENSRANAIADRDARE
jgi:hypothetical protein